MDRRLSEPAAYLRPVGHPKPTREPYPHWRETREERKARLVRQREEIGEGPQLINFGEQLQIMRDALEAKRREEAVRPRCVY